MRALAAVLLLVSSTVFADCLPHGPVVVASVGMDNQNADIGTATLYTTPDVGDYVVHVYIAASTGFPSGLSVTIGWVDGTYSYATSHVVSVGQQVNGPSHGAAEAFPIHVDGSTNITYATSHDSATDYSFVVVLEKL